VTFTISLLEPIAIASIGLITACMGNVEPNTVPSVTTTDVPEVAGDGAVATVVYPKLT
jgi:hypothetical protein